MKFWHAKSYSFFYGLLCYEQHLWGLRPQGTFTQAPMWVCKTVRVPKLKIKQKQTNMSTLSSI